jgi:hypothetical protein
MPTADKTKNGDGRILNFEIAVAPESEALSFKLGDQKFKCIPQIPGIFIAEFFATTEKEVGTRMGAALALIRGALAEEEEARFEEFIRSKKVIIPVQTLAQLAVGLVEEYAARPTTPPPD